MIEEKLQGYAELETPPSRLQAEQVYRHAVTVERRRRTAAVSGVAVLMVLALVGIGYALPSRSPAGPSIAGTPAPRSAPVSGGSAAAPPGPVLSPLPPVAAGCTVAPVPGADPSLNVDSVSADPTGHYLILRGVVTAVLVSDGHFQDMPSGFQPWVVNAAGTVAGITDEHAAVLRNGVVTVLPMPSGVQHVVVAGINARGDIAGGVYDDIHGHHAVLWPAAGGYKMFGEQVSAAYAIADDGTVFGTVSMAPTSWTPDGKATRLPLPPGYHSGWASYPNGGTLFGEVAPGRPGDDPAGDSKGELTGPAIYARWNLRTGAVEQVGHPESGLYPTLGAVFSATVDTVGVSGTIIATVDGKPVLYRGTTPVALPQYQGRSTNIQWISADGRTIIGLARRSSADHPSLAVVWTGC